MNASSQEPSTLLFTDWRHVLCSDLEWVSSCGDVLPVVGPPGSPVKARARPGRMPRGIRFVAQPAQKTEPFLGNIGHFKIACEAGVYRLWRLEVIYPPGRDLGSYSKNPALSAAIVHQQSDDGFTWRKPVRSVINAAGQAGLDGFTVFLDPTAKASERYKAVWMALAPRRDCARLWRQYQQLHPRHRDARQRENHLTCVYGAVSPDGLRWRALREPIFIHKSDTDTTVEYDEWLGKYVMYTRLVRGDRRWVGRAETDDFRRWPSPEPLIGPSLDGPPSDDIYTNGKTRYPGLPCQHLAFPMVYHRDTQLSDVHLYTSADNVHWERVPGGPVIPHGPCGAWDSAFVTAFKDMVPMGNDRVAVPYIGTSFPHKYPRWQDVLEATRTAWACWPRGRLCALTAERIGTFHTYPLSPTGRRLRLNVRTQRTGFVRVGVVDGNGCSLGECDAVSGDGLTLPVHWKGNEDIGVRAGQPVTLHFELRAAELFGLEWV